MNERDNAVQSDRRRSGACTGLFPGGAGERLAIVGLMAVVYALLGALAGYLSGAWQPGIWLAVPAVLIAAVLGEWGWVLTGVAATAVGASTGGAYCGARLKGRRRSHRRR